MRRPLTCPALWPRPVIIELSSEPPPATAFDVVVVGAGVAGIILAMELLESGRRVCLLEGGQASYTEQSQARYRGEVSYPEGFSYPALHETRLRYLGGSSNHWTGWCRPLEANCFAPREVVGGAAWPIPRGDLDEAYARANEWCSLGRPEFDAETLAAAAGVVLPVTGSDALDPITWRFSDPSGDGPWRGAVRFGERYRRNLADAAADELLVALGANFAEFVREGRRVTGVAVVAEDGTEHTFRGDRTVLACGTIESVRLLRLLAAAVPDVDRSGRLGSGFMEHLHVDLGIVMADAADVEAGAFASMTTQQRDEDGSPFRLGVALTESAQERLSLTNVSFLLREDTADLPLVDSVDSVWRSLGRSGLLPLRLSARMEQRPVADSAITLDTVDDDVRLRRPRLAWRVDPRDVEALTTATALVARELALQGVAPFRDATVLGTRVINAAGGHHMGGAVMDPDPELGVVDVDLRVHAFDNLYLASAAVFPVGGAAPPTLTLAALAVRLADALEVAA